MKWLQWLKGTGQIMLPAFQRLLRSYPNYVSESFQHEDRPIPDIYAFVNQIPPNLDGDVMSNPLSVVVPTTTTSGSSSSVQPGPPTQSPPLPDLDEEMQILEKFVKACTDYTDIQNIDAVLDIEIENLEARVEQWTKELEDIKRMCGPIDEESRHIHRRQFAPRWAERREQMEGIRRRAPPKYFRRVMDN